MIDERNRELEHALLLMVCQYCTVGKDERAWMDHECMSAGENAFSVLGIERGDPADEVWARIERIEEAGIPGATQARKKEEASAWETIYSIIRHGNDAIIRKKGDGYIILEDRRTIRYNTPL